MKRTIASGCCVTLLAATVAGGANATSDTFSKAVVAGGTLQLSHYASVNMDCSSAGRPEVRIVTGPSSGAVRVVQGLGFSHFSNDYAPCSARRVHGATVNHAPEKGFLGSDTVQLDVVFPNGFERIDTYNITVK